jgi:hypothetical protein
MVPPTNTILSSGSARSAATNLVLFNRRVTQSTTKSYAENDYFAQLCGYLCVPLRLNNQGS